MKKFLLLVACVLPFVMFACCSNSDDYPSDLTVTTSSYDLTKTKSASMAYTVSGQFIVNYTIGAGNTDNSTQVSGYKLNSEKFSYDKSNYGTAVLTCDATTALVTWTEEDGYTDTNYRSYTITVHGDFANGRTVSDGLNQGSNDTDEITIQITLDAPTGTLENDFCLSDFLGKINNGSAVIDCQAIVGNSFGDQNNDGSWSTDVYFKDDYFNHI